MSGKKHLFIKNTVSSKQMSYKCDNQLITWLSGVTRPAGSCNLFTLKTNFTQYKNFVWPIFSFLWRIWKWKENGTKKLTFPDGDLTLDFWTGFRPRFEFWGRLDQSSSRFLKNFDFKLLCRPAFMRRLPFESFSDIGILIPLFKSIRLLRWTDSKEGVNFPVSWKVISN